VAIERGPAPDVDPDDGLRDLGAAVLDRMAQHLAEIVPPAGRRYTPGTVPQEYSPDAVRAYHDEFGDREWDRLERRPMDRVNLELHRRLLARLVRRGDRVLEVGAGPGRFTIQLAQLGAKVTVVDISPRQLELNRERVVEAGCEQAVEVRGGGGLGDLSRFDDGSFDVATAFGGPLSYFFERARDGLDQLLRKTRLGGSVAFSVMSKWGALRMALAAVLEFERQGLGELNRQMIETGDVLGQIAEGTGMSLPPQGDLLRWEEIEPMLEGRPCELIDAAAANYLSVNLDDMLEKLSEAEWAQFLNWEEIACRSKGVLDAGTHILVAVRRA